jgi:hypothetical protein
MLFSRWLVPGSWFFALRTSFLALSSLYIVHRPTGADLGQEPGYWTVPAPGALFVTGSRFWPIVRLSQDRTGKGLALRWFVGWQALTQGDRPGATSMASRPNCLMKPAKGFLRLSKKLTIDPTSKQLPDRFSS